MRIKLCKLVFSVILGWAFGRSRHLHYPSSSEKILWLYCDPDSSHEEKDEDVTQIHRWVENLCPTLPCSGTDRLVEVRAISTDRERNRIITGKTPQERWLLWPHAREGMLLEHCFKGPGNLATQINHFWKLSGGNLVPGNPPALSALHLCLVFGGAHGNTQRYYPCSREQSSIHQRAGAQMWVHTSVSPSSRMCPWLPEGKKNPPNHSWQVKNALSQ